MRSYLLFLLLIPAAAAVRYKVLCTPASANPAPSVQVPDERSLARIQAEIQDLQKALVVDNEPYIVIDTVHNRLQIRRGDRILKEAVCSTGSGKVLLDKKREAWYFNTPRKVFQVQRKVEGPIWKKPKWAFVEQGQPAPVLPWDFRRLDPITLGKYALELGDGYAIHGNLYPNLIGRHITHGCIRLNDADLEAAYALTKTGSRVYIY